MKRQIFKKWCIFFVLFVSMNALVLADENEKGEAAEHSSGHHSEEGVNPEKALIKLQEGNKKYMSFGAGSRVGKTNLEEVYNGQKPYVVILSCSDSRVAPEYIFDEELGKIFIIRNAGNVVDPVVLGSIEYAAVHLGAKLLVVMGHEKCGAVTAAVNKAQESANITAILNEIKPAVETVEKMDIKEDLVEKAIVENANIMSKRVLEGSPAISNLVKEGKFKIISAKYFLKDGHVEFQ